MLPVRIFLQMSPFPLLADLAAPATVQAERLPIRRYTTADGLAHDRVKASFGIRAASSGSAPRME